MRKAAVVFFFAAWAINLAGTETEVATHSIAIPQHGVLRISAPKNWIASKPRPLPQSATYVKFASPEDHCVLQLTIFADPKGNAKNQTDTEIETAVRKMTEAQFRSTSVEKEIVIEKLKTRHIFGSFARFTDAKYENAAPPPNEFRNAATGMFRCSDVWTVFTLLTNEKDGEAFKKGRAALESIQKVPEKNGI